MKKKIILEFIQEKIPSSHRLSESVCNQGVKHYGAVGKNSNGKE